MSVIDLPATAIVDPRTFTDEPALYAMLAKLRRGESGMHYVEAPGFRPFWLTTRHADITLIEKEANRFINAPMAALFSLEHEALSRKLAGDRDHQEVMRNVIMMDGEEHRAYREITQAYFTPKGLAGISRDIEALAAEFVERMAAHDGTCDFAEIALPFPLRVIMTMLGIPEEDEPMMMRLTQQTLSSQDPEFQDGDGTPVGAMMKIAGYMLALMEDRRANPRSDLASVIANARVNGEYLPDRDVLGYYQIIATAGHDTTSYSLTGGLLALIQHPEEMAKLRADPSLMPTAVEEVLRWTAPVKHFCRTATEDREVGGRLIRKGDLVLLSYPAANRDEACFDDPESFRVDRRPNRQLAFGTGPHVCLGQFLARFELTAFFRELLAHVEDIELAGTPRFVEGTFVGGVKSLPIHYRMRQGAAG